MFICSYHIGSLHFSNNHFGVTNSPPYLYGTFTCFGYEESLSICPRSSYNSLLNCGDNEIAGVHCQGKNCKNIHLQMVDNLSSFRFTDKSMINIFDNNSVRYIYQYTACLWIILYLLLTSNYNQ